MSDAREVVLDRVRRAIADAETAEPVSRSYRRSGGRDRDAVVELFCERVRDYRAEAHVVRARQLRGAIADALASRGAERVAVPSAFPVAWRPPGTVLVEDTGQPAPELDRLDAVLTGCTLAIAETGTIILSGGPTEGRRALTLVPDMHVCVVGDAQIVELVPEAFERLAELGQRSRPITLISGPSATSDIELSRVEGVHGPRSLVVIVVERNQ